jgi:hypothetical protein
MKPCPTHEDCPDLNPFANLSAEDPDLDTTPALFFGWLDGQYPLLGFNWTIPTCLGVCDSDVSLEDALLCAIQHSTECSAAAVGKKGGVLSSGPPLVIRPFDPSGGQPLFPNDPQSCSIGLCADGSRFTFIVPRGTFVSPNADWSNEIARSYACRRAAVVSFCLNDIQELACTSLGYLQTITTSGGTAPITYEIIAGNLPPGMELDPNSNPATGRDCQIFGDPTEVGFFDFTIRATGAGNSGMLDKDYSIAVLGVQTTTLPDAPVGAVYNQQLVADGGVPDFTFTLVGGALPPGLSMSNSGFITGTPTGSAQTYNPQIKIEDFTGDSCVQTFTIKTTSVCNPTVTPGLDTGLLLALGDVAYATVSDRLFAVSAAGGSSNIKIVRPDTAVVEATLSLPGTIYLVFYEDLNKRVYVGYQDAVSTHGRIRVFNAASPYNQITDIDLGVTSTPNAATIDTVRNKVWFLDNNITGQLYVVNALTFAFSTITVAGSFVAASLVYCSNQDLIGVSGGIFSGGLKQGLVTYNPGTLGVVNSFVVFGSEDADNYNESAYSPDNGMVYLNMYSDGVLRVNPATGATLLIAIAGWNNAAAIAWNPCTHRITAVKGFTADNIKAAYIPVSTDTLLSTVNAGVVMAGGIYPGRLVFDSRRSRLWFSTGNKVLEFT